MIEVKAIYAPIGANPFEGRNGPPKKSITAKFDDGTPWDSIVASAEKACKSRAELQGWECTQVLPA